MTFTIQRGAFLLAMIWSLSGTFASAEETPAPTPDQLEFFEKKIRPVLVQHCYSCHAADSKILRGSLLVDTRAGLLMGGDSGPAVVPGDPDESVLLSALKYESYEMPPKEKLPETVIADFEKWIEMGAPDPRDGEAVIASTGLDIESGREFWAFKPLAEPAVPTVQNTDWPRDSIDRFILAAQEQAGLSPSGDADRLVLLRRLSFDLTGLPPTPEQMQEFLADASGDALERLIDSLLQSPRFGERWGRHWLDMARYADSTGGGRSMLYKQSWRYRDYVIDAINRDQPYDQFILEQLAGDLLSSADLETRHAQLTATAFLALGPSNYEEQDKEQLRMDVVDEQVDTIGKVFLGMTLGCARCHDHKFDPIPQSDYYALAGIFRSTQTLIHDNVSSWISTPLPLPPEQQQQYDQYAEQAQQLEKEVTRLGKRLKQLEQQAATLPVVLVDDDDAQLTGTWTTSTYHSRFVGNSYRHTSDPKSEAVFSASLSPGRHAVQFAYNASGSRTRALRVEIRHAEGSTVRILNQQQAPEIEELYCDLGTYEFDDTGSVSVQSVDDRHTIIDGVRFVSLNGAGDESLSVWKTLASARQRRQAFKEELTAIRKLMPKAPPKVLSVRDEAEIADYRIGIRGSVKILGDPVPRGFLTVATHGSPPVLPADQSGRLELAHWIASPDNPLTARVFVNRVWSHLFGRGLVRTVDNFGITGETPSHPELLDYLAREFQADGWSLKRLVRRIVLTRTYQLSTQGEISDADPENRLLTHQNRRRLDAESIHDALLLVGGELNDVAGGDTIGSGEIDEYTYLFEYGRRAVYLPVLRNRLPEVFLAFDFPDPNLSQGSRIASTLPTQALFLLNSPFIMDRAAATAKRLQSQPLPDDAARLTWLTRSLLGRDPTAAELALVEEFLGSSTGDSAARWERVAQVFIGSIDFRYLD